MKGYGRPSHWDYQFESESPCPKMTAKSSCSDLPSVFRSGLSDCIAGKNHLNAVLRDRAISNGVIKKTKTWRSNGYHSHPCCLSLQWGSWWLLLSLIWENLEKKDLSYWSMTVTFCCHSIHIKKNNLMNTKRLLRVEISSYHWNESFLWGVIMQSYYLPACLSHWKWARRHHTGWALTFLSNYDK